MNKCKTLSRQLSYLVNGCWEMTDEEMLCAHQAADIPEGTRSLKQLGRDSDLISRAKWELETRMLAVDLWRTSISRGAQNNYPLRLIDMPLSGEYLKRRQVTP